MSDLVFSTSVAPGLERVLVWDRVRAMPEPTGNAAFDAARAGGVVDTFLSMPDTRERQSAKYDHIRRLANDAETKAMEMPAEYMFKGVPKHEDAEVEDPLQLVLEQMDHH